WEDRASTLEVDEGGPGAVDALDAQDQAVAGRQIEEVDGHLGLGETGRRRPDGAWAVRGVQDQHVALQPDLEPRVLEADAHGPGLPVRDEQVKDVLAHLRDRAHALDRRSGTGRRLAQRVERGGPIRDDEAEILRHPVGGDRYR